MCVCFILQVRRPPRSTRNYTRFPYTTHYLSAYASDHSRVIDASVDRIFLFSEALSATGDRFALHGFSSLRRGQVRFHHIKGFDERYDGNVRGRIAAIKPGFYTRMGAAIRPASNLMAEQKHQQRLLLLLTDGKPNGRASCRERGCHE